MAAGLFPPPVPADVRAADRGQRASRPRRPGARLGKPRLLARHLGHRQPRPAVLRREIRGRALAGGRPLRTAATDRLHRSRPPRPYGRGERDGRPAPRRGRHHRAVPGRHLERRQPRAAVSLVARRRGAGGALGVGRRDDPAAAARDHLHAAKRPAADPARPAGDRLVRRHGPGATPRGVPRRRPVRGAGHLRGADPLRRRNRSQARDRQGRGGGAAGLSRGCHSGAARRASPKAMDKRNGALAVGAQP